MLVKNSKTVNTSIKIITILVLVNSAQKVLVKGVKQLGDIFSC